MRQHIQRSLVVAVVSVAALTASAGEGRIPIPFQAPVTFPILITAPGKYVVTRDLVGPGGTAVIEIDSPDVEIDLNGKVISNGFPGIRINLLAEAVIRNGAIESGGVGIEGVTGLNDVVVEDVHISDLSSSGILLNDPDTYVIRRCIIEDVAGVATVEIRNGTLSQGTIESNVIRRSSGVGIFVDSGAGVVIRDNRLKEVSGFGIRLGGGGEGSGGGALVSENTLEGCGSAGIVIMSGFDGCKLISNLVLNSGGQGPFNQGIHILSSDHLVLENVVRDNQGSGISIQAGTGNHIRGNVLSSNGISGTGYGLVFGDSASDNTFGHNTGFGNAGGPCANPVGNEVCEGGAVPDNVSFGDNLMPPSLGLF